MLIVTLSVSHVFSKLWEVLLVQCAGQAACVLGQARERVCCLAVVVSCPGAHDWNVLCVQSFIPSSAFLGGLEFLILRAAVLSEPQTGEMLPWAGLGRA